MSNCEWCVEVLTQNPTVLLIQASQELQGVSSVISALVQLMVDPTYRSLSGFRLLLEKEWCDVW
jgi:hypothetical protein